jgi:hypothetical protein
LHLLAAVLNPSYLEFLGFGLKEFIKKTVELRGDDEVLVPERPGHGIVLCSTTMEIYCQHVPASQQRAVAKMMLRSIGTFWNVIAKTRFASY